MNPSTRLARDVVQALLDSGVSEVVLAPGSRNAPLAFALWDADRQGLLRLHTRIDERTAGFLALGLTKGGRRAAVVCTSGTAVANLFPAVMEAAHAGVALVVVTADRPAGLRGTGASQTTDQVEVFGGFARFLDVAAPTAAPTPGVPRWERPASPEAIGGLLAPEHGWLSFDERHGAPPSAVAHLNVQFDLPLTPDAAPAAYAAPEPGVGRCRMEPTTADGSAVLARGARTVVVAGDDAGPRARQVAEVGGWPLFAEPSSGARTGDHALRTYRLLLDSDLAQQIERVIVFGHPTLSRPVARLLAREDVEVISVRHAGIWADRPFAVAAEHGAVWVEAGPETPQDDEGWLDAWRDLDRTTGREIDRLLHAESDVTPHEAVRAVNAAVPAGGLLFVGASSPIRDLDIMARPAPVGTRRKVVSNRGVAGIDGTISSAIGVALARDPHARNIALMGDVTFLHDAGALVLGPAEPRPDLTIVVVNDDGGSIFTMLEQGAPEYTAQYDRLFGTPHGVDIASLCGATRIPHWKVESLPELEQALASPNGGIEVIEVRVRRDNRRDLDAALRRISSPA